MPLPSSSYGPVGLSSVGTEWPTWMRSPRKAELLSRGKEASLQLAKSFGVCYRSHVQQWLLAVAISTNSQCICQSTLHNYDHANHALINSGRLTNPCFCFESARVSLSRGGLPAGNGYMEHVCTRVPESSVNLMMLMMVFSAVG